MRKREKRQTGTLGRMLELPKEITTNEPKLTIVGFKEILIENYKGIMEYEDFYIRINTHIGTLNINGFNLKLTQMTEDDILVTGKIDSIDLETVFDEEEKTDER